MEEYPRKGPYNRIESTELMYTRACRDAELVFVDDTVQAPFSVVPHMATMSYENPSFRHLVRFDSYRDDLFNQNYARLSERHGRSLLNIQLSGTQIWEDTYGIPFSAVDLKGSVANRIELDHGMPSSYNVRTNGLYELTYTDEAPEASKKIRSLGLPTEAYAKVWRLNSIPKDRGHISVDTLKKKIKLKAFLSAHGLPFSNAKILQDDMNKYLDNTEFAILERHTPVPVRVIDLLYPQYRDELFRVLNPVFWFINEAYADKKRSIIPGRPPEKHVDIFSLADIEDYIMLRLPTTIGAYLATMHNNDIVHGFPSKQNWSLLGTVCDLDSVDGPGVNPDYNEDLLVAKHNDLRFIVRGQYDGTVCRALTRLVRRAEDASEQTFFMRLENSYWEHLRK